MNKIVRYFNMIEVTLAIAVVGLGITGIMSLFPVGLNATRDAVGDNYAANSAEEFLNYIEQAAQSNWTIVTSLPASIANDRGSTKWNTNDWDHDKDGDSTDDTDPLWKITGVSDIYGIKQGNDSTAVYDFVAEARIWKSDVSTEFLSNPGTGGTTSYTDAGNNYSAVLNIEISWPVTMPYTQRSKRYFYKEIFKPEN